MDVFFTLDYELFLGAASGSVEKCLVESGRRLSDIALSHGAHFTIFVDTTYLVRLKEPAPEHDDLGKDYETVCAELEKLSADGHDLQLHIHPQWAFSDYIADSWNLDTKHYKLSDIDADTAHRLFGEGCEIIKILSGKAPVGFRAGGFSAQPTDMLRELFIAHGLRIDSSVYPGNVYHSKQQDYDYSESPMGRIYSFDDDIVKESPGRFLELPLTVHKVSPMFYWRLVSQRLSRRQCHRRIGDGISVKTIKSSIFNRLVHRSNGFATIDESKISYLMTAYREAKKRGDKVFCVIGHPKLATEYSLRMFDKVLGRMAADGAVFRTLSQI